MTPRWMMASLKTTSCGAARLFSGGTAGLGAVGSTISLSCQTAAFQRFWCAQVAQLVEQRTENPRVGGSNPPLGTTTYIPLGRVAIAHNGDPQALVRADIRRDAGSAR
jgi:hypothetical protein